MINHGHCVWKREISYIEKISICFFYFLILMGLFMFSVFLLNRYFFHIRIPECYLHRMMGYYCFGCGGTRAVRTLLQGNMIKSIFYHVAVPYMAAGYVVYIVSHLARIISKNRIKWIHFCPLYFYILIGIIIIQCLAKNIALWQGFDFLKWVDHFSLF